VFGTKNGWERADYFRPGEPPRRAGEDQRAVGWTRPPWYDRVAVEHAAIRERLGIIDMTSFGKLETSDLDVLERVCDARIDRAVGSVVYTQLLDDRGHIVGDVTVTRLAQDRFRVVAGAVDSDRGFLELHGATVTDVTDAYAVIGIWGPQARAALAAITKEDVSDVSFPFRTAKELEFGLAQRITYVGELGYELYVPREGAVAVWDALMAAEPVPVGYQALDSLRIEKGYRYFGTDMTASDTPFDSGVGFCVAKGKFPQLDRRPATRLRTLVVGGEEYLTVYGGEAVHRGDEVIGRVRSAAYGFTLRRNIALAKLPASLAEGDEVQVDVMGDLVPAVVSPDALYDPQNVLVKS
jgi:4-methylaminobutanoate oxidase (formaldehyde-forming)